MEEGDSPVTIWEDLDNDILVKILQSFDVFELSAGLAHVCNAWRLACCDQLPLKTLDLSKSEAVVMEKGDFPVRKWEDLDINILVKILQSFDLFQLINNLEEALRICLQSVSRKIDPTPKYLLEPQSWKHTNVDLPS
ncbi:hypothetical protein KY285_016566 [Solanum tuberosum]|nr:hypothetical protein KY284_016577 [Solanum tuberosum]KAH0702288.1 hypothetical protein KY285_016566 [Solanum tuberosum]